MSDENMNNQQNRNYGQGNRPRHQRNDHRNNFRMNRHGGGGGGGRGGRVQRPLLTSSVNGAGLALVCLVLLHVNNAAAEISNFMALTAASFAVSSVISYFAQRASQQRWIEKISDLFFMIGALLFIIMAFMIAQPLALIGL